MSKLLSLLLRTNEGILHKIWVTYEDVDRFWEVKKMDVNVINTSDKKGSSVD